MEIIKGDKSQLESRDSESGMTPLMTAVYYNHPDLVRRLIEEGADIRAVISGYSPWREGNTALDIANHVNLPYMGQEYNTKNKAIRQMLEASASSSSIGSLTPDELPEIAKELDHKSIVALSLTSKFVADAIAFRRMISTLTEKGVTEMQLLEAPKLRIKDEILNHQELKTLAIILNKRPKPLHSLDLRGCDTKSGIRASCDAIAGGALSQLTTLLLSHNRIDNDGMTRLAAVSGGLASLQQLWLNDNEIRDLGLESLSYKLWDGALPSLQILRLDNNKYDSRGMTALSDAIERGALASLRILRLDMQHLLSATGARMKAACKARGIQLVGSR